jgi:SAM-dependent methyltransferase
MNMRISVTLFAAFITPVVLVPATAASRGVTYLGQPQVPARAFPRPNRPVAEIVSPTRSTEETRDAAAEFQTVVRLLQVRPGMAIGDIGAGSGYYTVRLSPLVGNLGVVVAQDVKREYLTQLGARLKRSKLSNVWLALGEPHDPRLPSESLDAAIVAHVYHEIAEPYGFLYNLAPALRPGARVGIIDLDKPIPQHGTPPAVLRCELAAVGYREIAFHTLPADMGYLAIFEPPAAAALPSPDAIKPCKLMQ